MKTAMSVPSWRRTVGVMLLASVVALVLVVSLGASADKASAATKLVTKSFSNTQLILIPENAPTSTSGSAFPYPSNIAASFPAGSKVRDVNVTLRNYTHTFPDDVDVLLVHAGKNRAIMSDVGDNNDVSGITIKLDDEAADFLPDDDQLTAGQFIPRNFPIGTHDDFPFPAPDAISSSAQLSGFDGLAAGGKWKLFVVDDSGTDVGKFAGGWTVQIKAAVPQ